MFWQFEPENVLKMYLKGKYHENLMSFENPKMFV